MHEYVQMIKLRLLNYANATLQFVKLKHTSIFHSKFIYKIWNIGMNEVFQIFLKQKKKLVNITN